MRTSKIYFQVLLLLQLSGWACVGPAKLQAQKPIYVPTKSDKLVMESVRDMAYWLQKAGAGSYQVIETDRPPQSGIRLVSVDDVSIEDSQKKTIKSNGQSFHLKVNRLDDVQIAGTGMNSFINGIYSFMHELGFRWYMPGDLWTRLGDIKKVPSINKVYNPSFRDRQYAGSGGASAIPGLDEKNEFMQGFREWNRRNRVNVDHAAKGHQGIAFYNANKAVLDKHPEYYCNRKISRNGRLNYDNPAIVKLFADWAIAQVKPTDPFPVIGVDPADGSAAADDCIPQRIPGVKTWSDKYYWMANQVASRLRDDDRNTIVALYAYNNYADTPSFPLHRSVYPVIIPYAFQEVDKPDAYIARWAKKMNGQPMGIYDYWNITQWSQCLPQFNITNLEERLKFWRNNNIQSVYLESTYAKGPMGHAFWLGTQLMWDLDQDSDKLFNEFLTDNFGDAAEDIKRMYVRWSTNYQWAAEAILSNDDLAKAAARVTDPLILERISELKAYVRFIRMMETYKANRTVEGYEELVRYILSIHHLRLLHTSALINLYIQKPGGYQVVKDRSLLAKKYSAVKPLNQVSIERNFASDRRKDPPSYSFSKLQFDVRNIRPHKGGEKMKAATHLNTTALFEFYVQQQGKFSIAAGATKDTRMLVRNQSGQVIFDKLIKASASGFEDIQLTLSPGYYSLQWGETRRFSRIRFPKELAVVSQDHGYDNAGFPWQYVYVPSDATEIVYQDLLGPGINNRGFWLNPDGKRVDAKPVMGTIYRVPVPPQYRGKAWVLNIGHRTFKMLNIPDYYSLNPFEYIEK